MNLEEKFKTLLDQYNFNITQHKRELDVKKQEYELQMGLHQSLLANSENTIIQLQNSNKSLTQMIKEQIQQLELKENQIRDSQRRSSEQRSQSNQGNDQQGRIQDLERNLQAANLKIQEWEQNAASANQNLADKLQECLRFSTEKRQLNKTIEELKKQQSENTNVDNLALNRKLEEQSNEYSRQLNKIKENYEIQISNIKSEKEETEKKIKKLQKEYDQIQKDKLELIRQNEALSNQNTQLSQLINQEPRGTLYPEIINQQLNQISELNEKLNQSSGVYNLYVPQESMIQEFQNKDVAQKFTQQFIENTNHFTSYPIEDLAGNVVGISLISKPSSQQQKRPLIKRNNFMS